MVLFRNHSDRQIISLLEVLEHLKLNAAIKPRPFATSLGTHIPERSYWASSCVIEGLTTFPECLQHSKVHFGICHVRTMLLNEGSSVSLIHRSFAHDGVIAKI